jgi:hypothetical protein
MEPQWKEGMDKLWSKTRVELDRASKVAKELMDKGEQHAKELSVRGAREVRKLSLNVQKEGLYFRLGKAIAASSPESWQANKKALLIQNRIVKIDHALKRLSRKK